MSDAQGTGGVRGPEENLGAPTDTHDLLTSSQQLIHIPGSSKARQKKFHRHFKQVAVEERVLNYYSCALVGDILLQGHLYITKNYFAFYSNVFGYVTKLLIPTADVLKVSKEKTAKFIPNAVGIFTEDEKHVFSSLLSRDSTYKLMVQVWKAATDHAMELKASELKHDIEDSASGEMLLDEESSCSASGNDDRLRGPPVLPVVANPETLQKLLPQVRKGTSLSIPSSFKSNNNNSNENWKSRWFKSPSFLMLSSLLVVVLFISAVLLLHRLIKIQETFSDHPRLDSENEYEYLLNLQKTLYATSHREMNEFLTSNLDQIARVRHSLEALSILIHSKGNTEDAGCRTEDPTVRL